MWLWENIAVENNLEFKYVEMPLKELLEALENNKIDASLSPLTITAKRYQTINFTTPYHIEHDAILERNEERKTMTNFIRALKAFGKVFGGRQ